FNTLLHRLNTTVQIPATKSWDSQKGSITLQNATFTFTFLRDIALAPQRLDDAITSHGPIGALVFNSGLWEQVSAQPQNTSYLIRYAKGVARFALHIGERFGVGPADASTSSTRHNIHPKPRLYFRTTTPLLFPSLDTWRQSWMSNTKITTLNDIATRILSLSSFTTIDTSPLFLPFWESKFYKSEAWHAGFHLGKRMNEAMLDLVVESVCGPKVGWEDVRVLGGLGREEVGMEFVMNKP
ncbi:hypothetical protein HDV00_001335, partial [Rhizophlyctis rosea]